MIKNESHCEWVIQRRLQLKSCHSCRWHRVSLSHVQLQTWLKWPLDNSCRFGPRRINCTGTQRGIGVFSNWVQIVTFWHRVSHVSPVRLLACFLHGHNVKHIFLRAAGMHTAERELGNSWWRRIRSGPADWSPSGCAVSVQGRRAGL